MPIRINIEVGYGEKFNFNILKEKCTTQDYALAITTIELAKTALLSELAKNMKLSKKE